MQHENNWFFNILYKTFFQRKSITMKKIIYILLISISSIIAQENSNPNVLFIVIDDLKPTLGAYYDNFAKTPFIDNIAKNGTTFLNNHVHCLPCN